MIISFTVIGEPVPKARPKPYFNRYTKKMHSYIPTKSRRAEYDFKMQSLQYKPAEPLTCAISLRVVVYRSIPKSFSIKKKVLAENGDISPTTRPDIDNFAKLVMDSLNKIFWNDDSQVITLVVSKHYSNRPRIEVALQTE